LRVKPMSPSAPDANPAATACGRGSGAAGRTGRLLLLSTLALLPLLAVAGLRPGTATAAGPIGPLAGFGAPIPTPEPALVPAVSDAAAPAAAETVPAALRPALGPAFRPTFRDIAGLSPRALAEALDAVACARSRGIAGRSDLLTLIDYSLPSTAPRLWVLDLARGRVLFHELVAHGAGSGDNYATRFSNAPDSRQTSLGLFLTGGTYEGGNGYSLKLNGLDPGINDLAEMRKIVMHGAWYVSADHVQHFGRLGRSWGCPALPAASAHAVIDAIKGGTFLFSYVGGAAPQTAQASLRSACAAPASPAGPASPAAGTALAAAATAAITAGTH
jgi:L,D-transpeptidase catalytic domain